MEWRVCLWPSAMTITYTFSKSFNPPLCFYLYQLNYNLQGWNQVLESFKILQRAENQRKGLEHPSEKSLWTWAVTRLARLATCYHPKSHSNKNNTTWWTTVHTTPGLSIHFIPGHWTWFPQSMKSNFIYFVLQSLICLFVCLFVGI